MLWLAQSTRCISQAHGPCQYVSTQFTRPSLERALTNQHLHPDDQLYYPFIKSTKNIIQAAEKSGTVKRVVFTQAGAGLIDSEVGDTYGNRMEHILDGKSHMHLTFNNQT